MASKLKRPRSPRDDMKQPVVKDATRAGKAPAAGDKSLDATRKRVSAEVAKKKKLR